VTDLRVAIDGRKDFNVDSDIDADVQSCWRIELWLLGDRTYLAYLAHLVRYELVRYIPNSRAPVASCRVSSATITECFISDLAAVFKYVTSRAEDCLEIQQYGAVALRTERQS
jgi:hypothetical protein